MLKLKGIKKDRFNDLLTFSTDSTVNDNKMYKQVLINQIVIALYLEVAYVVINVENRVVNLLYLPIL